MDVLTTSVDNLNSVASNTVMLFWGWMFVWWHSYTSYSFILWPFFCSAKDLFKITLLYPFLLKVFFKCPVSASWIASACYTSIDNMACFCTEWCSDLAYSRFSVYGVSNLNVFLFLVSLSSNNDVLYLPFSLLPLQVDDYVWYHPVQKVFVGIPVGLNDPHLHHALWSAMSCREFQCIDHPSIKGY